MAKNDTVDKLNKLFNTLLDKAEGEGVDLETKIEIFKEGIRWAAVQNKIPTEDSPDVTGRLGRIKRGLQRT